MSKISFDKIKYWKKHGLPEWSYSGNYCDCHPETCSCSDWVIKMGSTEMCTTNSEEFAKMVANRCALSEILCQLTYDYATGKIDGAEICRFVMSELDS